MALLTIDLTPRIGTEIRTDPQTLLSGAASAEIRYLLEHRGVVLFRNIHLSDEQQIEFARTLGDIEQGIFKITFDKQQNPQYAAYLNATHSWHIDRVDYDVPTLGSILSPRVLSPTGGQTEFANTYAAYEDLPGEEREYLDTLRVVHTIESSFRDVINPTEAEIRFFRSFPAKTQPLVWRHRSGRKSLALGVSACKVIGMDEAYGAALLDRLMKWSTQPQYVYQHQWQMGDMLIWDNTGTMHRVLPFDHESGRRLHRTTLAGVEPLAS
jgi:alpha-ketoglutarate-dependent taurine dioxygenase